jgi:hypothetical protein
MTAFSPEEELYFSFDAAMRDDEGLVRSEALRLPDFSCNWSRFSLPDDVRFRANGRLTDGCASITIADAEHEQIMKTVHDPICSETPENYSHIEIRQRPPTLELNQEPPRGYKPKSKGEKAKRSAWRRHIRNRLRVVIEPIADQ